MSVLATLVGLATSLGLGVSQVNAGFNHLFCAVAPARDKRQGEIENDEVRGITLAKGRGSY